MTQTPIHSDALERDIALTNEMLAGVDTDYKDSGLRKTMIRAAMEAAAAAIQIRHDKTEHTEQKIDGSFLTQGDKTAQGIILSHLEKLGQEKNIPFKFLAEEQSEIKTIADAIYSNDEQKREDFSKRMLTPEQWAQNKNGLCFVIDPIDGTYNYAHHKERACAVSIALQHNGETIASAIYVIEPNAEDRAYENGEFKGLKGRLYWAEKGKGAHAFCLEHPDKIIELKNTGQVRDDTPSIGNFVSDSLVAGEKYNHSVKGKDTEAMLEAIGPNIAFEQKDFIKSAVVGALKVVDPALNSGQKGGSAAYSDEYLMPWDEAGIQLFFDEAKIPRHSYAVEIPAGTPDAPIAPVTGMIAAPNEEMFERMKNVVEPKPVLGQWTAMNHARANQAQSSQRIQGLDF